MSTNNMKEAQHEIFHINMRLKQLKNEIEILEEEKKRLEEAKDGC